MYIYFIESKYIKAYTLTYMLLYQIKALLPIGIVC